MQMDFTGTHFPSLFQAMTIHENENILLYIGINSMRKISQMIRRVVFLSFLIGDSMI